MAAARSQGQVALEGVTDLTKISAGAPLGAFTFEFRKPGTLSDLFATTGAITPVGAGSAFRQVHADRGVPLGTYDVAIKGPKNLRVSLARTLLSARRALLPSCHAPGGRRRTTTTSVDSSLTSAF